MINYNQLNPFKKIYYGLTARTKIITEKIRFARMRNLQDLFDLYSNTYYRNKSYRMKWFQLNHQRTLAQWDSVTDSIFGGQSRADLFFDQQNSFISYQGYVDAKDKDRMVYYPFINFMRKYPFNVKLGPLRLFQVQAKTDGKPLQVVAQGAGEHLRFSAIKIHRLADLRKIPIQNMILRGTQQDYQNGISPSRNSSQYFSKHNESSIFQKDNESLKKIIKTEIWNQDQLQISNVGFRLVSTESQHRQIKIKNMHFCYKKGYEKFVKQYQNPYFYITKDQLIQENIHKQTKRCKVQFLKNTLEDLDVIDTGDLKYYRNSSKRK